MGPTMADTYLDEGNAGAAAREPRASRLGAPLFLISSFLAICAVALMLPISLPIGPMYWDLVLYFDAANRILDGQVPVLDFFMPVGPLGYYLFTHATQLFPDAQPLLLVSWSLLAVTAPLMAVVTVHVDRRSRAAALALLLPFLLFALLPFNGSDYYPYPGSDGFGIYNRQICQLLYCLTAALLFVRNERLLAWLIAAGMLALFFVKVTGLVAGALLCLMAFAAGRIGLRASLLALGLFLAVCGLLELWNGLTSAYVADIMALLALNSGSLLPRMLQAASHNFGVVLPASALCLLLLWRDRGELAQRLRDVARARPGSRNQAQAFALAVDHSAFWLGTALLAGLIFESQNTGSQAMIFLWPILLAVLIDAARPSTSKATFLGVTILALAAALPVAVHTVERAGRAWVGALANNVSLEQDNLKTLGRVNMRPVIDQRAERMQPIYVRHRATYQAITAADEMSSFLQFSDLDFQINWLRTTDDAVSAIRTYEAQHGIRFETILLMDFANPFPWLMDRSGVRHVTIGADPFRAVPPPDEDVIAAVGQADLALRPTCPITTSNTRLEEFYAPMLVSHERITLTPCFDAYVRTTLGSDPTGSGATATE
jgi:hypothetical protein